MASFRLLTFFFLLAWTESLFAQEVVSGLSDDYLCIKVKKNPAEYCNNKNFGKQASFALKKIIKIQTNNNKPAENKILNYDRLQNLVRYGKSNEQIASNKMKTNE